MAPVLAPLPLKGRQRRIGVLTSGGDGTEPFLQRFINELQILSFLAHGCLATCSGLLGLIEDVLISRQRQG